MTLSELTRDDYLSLKWHFCLLILCLALVVGALLFSNNLQNEANLQLNIARSDMNSAKNQLDQAEMEGETIGIYLERYAEIADHVVHAGDRLAMQERFAGIRARYNLSHIQLQIGSQSSYDLTGIDPAVGADARVTLQTSEIRTSLPLLHEGDLANLLTAVKQTPDLLLARDCILSSNSRGTRELLQLGNHLNAECSFLWYTFEVEEVEP